MSLIISDIVDINENSAFRSDVILHSYWGPDNADLVRNYIFTTSNASDRIDPARMLAELRDAVSMSLENRFLVQATYGHGKSHFGLVAANYFGRALGSPEASFILFNLEHSLEDPGALQPFIDFKEIRKPFLVLLMSGDQMPSSLPDKFFRALDQALSDTPETRSIQAPFWFVAAQRFFEQASPEVSENAEAFLGQRGLGLEGLKGALTGRNTKIEGLSTYQLCVELVWHLTGIKPDFGGETGLDSAVDWICNELCGAAGPLGGLLIVFDEFSVFAAEYETNHGGTVALQQLMNGIQRNRGKALFVALAQHEPEKLIPNTPDVSHSSLRKELERIKERRALHTSLVDVITAYFRVGPQWIELLKNNQGLVSTVVEASEVAHECFRHEYPEASGWTGETFQERVTRGCYPLHPFTTALLSSLEFEAGGAARRVLSFLTDDSGPLKEALSRPAVDDGQLTWVLPISLVDFFERQVGETIWTQYQAVNLPDLADEEIAILKAMVLQAAGRVKTKNVGYERVIGQLSGIPRQRAEDLLKDLEARRYIRYDPGQGIYSFWSGSNLAMDLQRMVDVALDKRLAEGRRDLLLRNLTTAGTNPGNDALVEGGLLKPREIVVDWGSQVDWTAEEIVVTRDLVGPKMLERALSRLAASPETVPQTRALLFLMLAQNDDDVQWFREEFTKALDVSLTLRSAPYVFVRPAQPTPDLMLAIERYTVFVSKEFLSDAKVQLGQQIDDVYRQERERLEGEIRSGLDKLWAAGHIEVPLDTRGVVKAMEGPAKGDYAVGAALRHVVEIAYHSHQAAFFTQYSTSSHNLRNAVRDLIPLLLTNGVGPARPGLSKVPQQTVDLYLLSDNAWGILGANYQLREPTSLQALKAWRFLEESIPGGDKWVVLEKPLKALLKPPYGYNHFTLSLLVAGWIGLNRRQLEFRLAEKRVSLGDIQDLMTAGGKPSPKDFILGLAAVLVKRKDVNKERLELEAEIREVEEGGLTRQRAEFLAARLRAAIEDGIVNGGDLESTLRESLQRIEAGISEADEYDRQVESVLTTLNNPRSHEVFSRAKRSMAQLTRPVTVVQSGPDLGGLRQRIDSAIYTYVRDRTSKLCGLTDLTLYGKQVSDLRELLRHVKELHNQDAQELVEDALKQLDGEKAQLEAAVQEENDLKLLRVLDATGSFQKLQANLKTIHEIEVHATPRVRELALALKEEIQGEIDRLSDFLMDLDDQISGALKLDDLEAVEKGMAANQSRFPLDVDQDILEEAAARCSLIRPILESLEKEVPGTPSELEAAVRHLSGLAQEPEVSGFLSSRQIEAVRLRAQDLESVLAGRKDEALSWLERVKSDDSNGVDPGVLLERVQHIPLFLPEDRLSQVRELAERLRAEADDARQIAEREAEIRSIGETGSLVDLQLSIDKLKEISDQLPGVRGAAEAKIDQLAVSLKTLEDQVPAWSDRLGAATDPKIVDKLRDEIQISLHLYLGSELQPDVEGLAAQAKQVAEILRDATPENDALAGPAFVEAEETRLQKLASSATLSQAQQAVLGSRISELLRAAEDRRQRAVGWLQELEQDDALDDPEKVLASLESGNPWLPATEVGRLDTLHRRAETLLRLKHDIQNAAAFAASATSREDLENGVKRLRELILASPAPEGIIKVANDHLLSFEADLREKVAAGGRWLGEIETMWETTKDVAAVNKRIGAQPKFLSLEDEGRLSKLKDQIEERINTDSAARIQAEFETLARRDRLKALECLRWIQQLLSVKE